MRDFLSGLTWLIMVGAIALVIGMGFVHAVDQTGVLTHEPLPESFICKICDH